MTKSDASPTWDCDEREWLEADHLGGFAMGTVSGIRTRRYHTLLTTATTPPTGRIALVNGVEVWIETEEGPLFLTSHRYVSGALYPDGDRRRVGFDYHPWPTWTHRIAEGVEIVHELVCEPTSGHVLLKWRAQGSVDGPIKLAVRPLLSVRDYHSLHHRNERFRFDATVAGSNVAWRPYEDRPGVTVLSNGHYEHAPQWYCQFLYEMDQRRGQDHVEDLASPGILRFQIASGHENGAAAAVMVLRAGHAPYGDATPIAHHLEALEQDRRQAFSDPLDQAADAYFVRRGDGLTVVAGYPWFTDWGRDTFIAVRGLSLSRGRLDEARRVLLAWTDAVSEGMLPNRFPDRGEEPEYNAVDSSLWFVVVVGELLAAYRKSTQSIRESERSRLLEAVCSILDGYRKGTRFGIQMDSDGLIAAGEPGMQLTWMDAKVGKHVITPRIGKPVEVQALWINALRVGEQLDPELRALREKASATFLKRFPRGDGSLFDVVDADHVAGKDDPTFRPNQVFAVGGLPLPLLEGPAARALVDAVEARLWTPIGLRSLDPADPSYRGIYQGGVEERDGAYHQGTVWPWLTGAFVEAWLRVRGNTQTARAEAAQRFFAPMLQSLETFGLGHVPEIVDGDAPHRPRGAPFQAWSLGELLRVQQLVSDQTKIQVKYDQKEPRSRT